MTLRIFPNSGSSSKDDMRLTAWEKLIMRDVLASRPGRPSAIPHSSPLSSPVRDRRQACFTGVQDKGNQRRLCGKYKIAWKPVDHEFVSTPLTMPAGSKEMKDLIASYRWVVTDCDGLCSLFRYTVSHYFEVQGSPPTLLGDRDIPHPFEGSNKLHCKVYVDGHV